MAPRSRTGFTLIEMLVVMGIVITLTAMLAIGLMGARDKAMNKGSVALVQKIKVALESYHADFREYPPDGYDNEGTWDHDTAAGINVGTPPRRVKGSAALMYFLCRPLIKVSFVGADISDPRNRVMKRVGPYIKDLQPENFSMRDPQDIDGEPEVFSPGYNWADNDYWDIFLPCEIVDAYGRPLCYDKVKTSDLPGAGGLYWDPARFQQPGAASDSSRGHYVHSDRALFDSGQINIFPEQEPEGYHDNTFEEVLEWRWDPRLRENGPDLPWGASDLGTYLLGLFETGDATPVGSEDSHAPQYTGGYDLWSSGRSWIDPRDDIKSWE